MVAILAISIYVVPWIGLFLPILFLLTAYIYLRSIAAVKEVSRIESVTKSPLLSFLSETLSGSSTIRAFDKREEFVEQFHTYLNRNILANEWKNGVPFWF